MQHVAIILAGGTGKRVGGNTPKQLLPLADGRSILEHAVDAFEMAPAINEIAIVMHPDWINEANNMLERNSWQKVKKIIPGGTERWESSWHAIQAYKDLTDCSILLHDAARPFVSQEIIANVCEALETYPAVTVAVPVTDTLYRIDKDKVADIPPRNEFMRAQTPQAFHIDIIEKAYLTAIQKDKIEVTDDAGIVHKFLPEVPIHIVCGEETNRKITYKNDL